MIFQYINDIIEFVNVNKNNVYIFIFRSFYFDNNDIIRYKVSYLRNIKIDEYTSNKIDLNLQYSSNQLLFDDFEDFSIFVE